MTTANILFLVNKEPAPLITVCLTLNQDTPATRRHGRRLAGTNYGQANFQDVGNAAVLKVAFCTARPGEVDRPPAMVTQSRVVPLPYGAASVVSTSADSTKVTHTASQRGRGANSPNQGDGVTLTNS